MFLSIPSGHNVANLLRGTFLQTLLETGTNVVVLSPVAGDARFTKEFAGSRVSCALLPPHTPRALEQVVESILSEQFLLESGLRAVRLQRDRARLLEAWRGRRLLAAAKSLVCRLPVSRRRWFAVAARLSDSRRYDPLFDRHRPDLVVTSTAGFLTAEAPLIYAAQRRGVPQVGVDLGWDNLSSKYHTVLPVDFLAVWNETMRDEAVRYHGLSPDRVSVCGAAQFDGYFGGDVPARSAFIDAIGGDASQRIVTLATAPQAVYPSTATLVERLAEAVADGALGAPAQLLVRVHPRDTVDAYLPFAERPHVIVEKPFERFDAPNGVSPFDAVVPTPAGRRHLAATLAHSDVLVNFASTTTIEACVFDTPVVNIGFDDEAGLPLPLSIRRYYQYEHYQPVVETGAAHIAENAEDLVTAVGEYLRRPELDRTARRALVERVCTFTDADSGRRLGRWVSQILGSVAAARAVSGDLVAKPS